MNELSVGTPELQVTVRCSGDVWPVARAAYEAARLVPQQTDFPTPIGGRNQSVAKPAHGHFHRRRSKANQVRKIARQVLSDGRLHQRREIVQAVREAGLDPQTLTKQLEGHFERAENVDGVLYRDPKAKQPDEPKEVASGGDIAGEGAKAEYPIHRIENLLGRNGGGGA